MIDPKLKDPQYYRNKLTLWLRQCFGIKEQLDILSDVIAECDNYAEFFMKCFDVMDTLDASTNDRVTNLEIINGGHFDYLVPSESEEEGAGGFNISDACAFYPLERWNAGDGSASVSFDNIGYVPPQADGKTPIPDDVLERMRTESQFNYYDSDILDLIGEIVGVNRYITVNYGPLYTFTDNRTESTLPARERVSNKLVRLTNSELYRCIRCRIVQNNYHGTYEELEQLYRKIGLNIYIIDMSGNNFSDRSAEAFLYLDNRHFDPLRFSELKAEMPTAMPLTINDKYLFLMGYYTIRSMGISYTVNIIDLRAKSARWDESMWGLNEDQLKDPELGNLVGLWR